MNLENIDLSKTCFACPEAYDVYYQGDYIGHLRLRHGCFTASREGRTLYEGFPKGDGIFEEEEREYYLTMGKIALMVYHMEKEYE